MTTTILHQIDATMKHLRSAQRELLKHSPAIDHFRPTANEIEVMIQTFLSLRREIDSATRDVLKDGAW